MSYKTIVKYFLALVAVAISSPENIIAAEVSQWQSDFGPLKLSITNDMQVTGDYPNYQGTLEGTIVDDNQMELYWYQPKSEVICKQPMNGSRYWGRVTWKITAGNRLTGGWSYCNQTPGSGGKWNATLTSGALPGKKSGIAARLQSALKNSVPKIAHDQEETNEETKPQPEAMEKNTPKGFSLPKAKGDAPENNPPQSLPLANKDKSPKAMNDAKSDNTAQPIATTTGENLSQDDLLAEIRMQWGQIVDMKAVKQIKEDITCDGGIDLIASRVNLDNPDGELFDILVVTREKNKIINAAIAIGKNEFCTKIAKSPPTITTQTFSDHEVRKMVGPGACNIAIKVADEKCDPHYFFWLPESKGSTRFTMFRH